MEAQSTLFDVIEATNESTKVISERPDKWKEMLFDVGEISVSVNENDRLKSANQPINFVEGHSVVADYKALVNKITGSVISIVRKTYHAVSNIDVLNHFETLLNEQNIRFEYGFSKSARNGRKSVFEIILPDLKIDLGNGDTQEMRLYVQNSFDGGNAIRLQMGFFRHLCSNMALMHGKAR